MAERARYTVTTAGGRDGLLQPALPMKFKEAQADYLKAKPEPKDAAPNTPGA